MKYTIPYEDKILLPHIKEILSIDLKTSGIVKENEDLVGKVIVYGEYTLDNSEDIMEFTHEIPISLLVDDTDIEPVISFSNFEYELVKGRSIEIMFDLEVTIETREEQFQKEVDEKLDEALNVEGKDPFASVNEALQQSFQSDEPTHAEFEQEVNETVGVEKNKVEDAPIDEEEMETKEDREMVKEPDDEEVGIDYLLNELDPADENGISVEPLVIDEDVEEKPETGLVQVQPCEADEQFDIGFISNIHDKYTTYKVILLEGDEDVDILLAEKGLSKDHIVGGFDRETRKIILKLDHE